MANADYLPSSDSDLLIWFNNFKTKFVTYAPNLGFSAAEISGTSDDHDSLAFIVQTAETVRNHSQGFTAYKKALRDGPVGAVSPALPVLPAATPPANVVAPGIVPRLRATVQRIKTQPAYNQAMGADLGIIAPAAVESTTPPKPSATASAKPNSAVQIDWTKGSFDGVLVEGQRAAETTWTLLGTDLSSPYIDDRAPLTTGQPEVRRYRLRYINRDVPTGDYSDTMTVTTTP
jgi:hypothetical protein